MSRVTNVILAWSDYHAVDTLQRFNASLRGPGLQTALGEESEQELKLLGRSEYGGNKLLEHNVAVAAFNYIDVAALKKAFYAFPWEEPENAQLMLLEHDQEPNRFLIYHADTQRVEICAVDPWIIVCSACLRACCWQGEFMCSESRGAGVVKKKASELRALKLESEHYWKMK